MSRVEEMNIGEEFVSAYLQYINGCEFVQTNLYTIDTQGEIDVIGIDIDKKIVYVCEVAIHLETGLQYTKDKRPNNVNKLVEKFSRDIEYTNKNFESYKKVFILWSPIVKNQNPNAKYNQMDDIRELTEMIKAKYNIIIETMVNEKFMNCILCLRNYALNETKENKNPIIRFLQIEEKLKKHLKK